MTATETIVFIDEVEDHVARLVLGEQVFHMPRALLPADAREGQWLRISVAIAPAPPGDSAALRKRLGKGDPAATSSFDQEGVSFFTTESTENTEIGRKEGVRIGQDQPFPSDPAL